MPESVYENGVGERDAAVIVALGANLASRIGSPAATFRWTLEQLGVAGVKIVAVSRVWRSAAWPDPAAPAFSNAVAIVETPLSPEDLLALLHRLEEEAGRVRCKANDPRPLDLDLIAFGRSVQVGSPVLPHPRAHERLFVMGPLAQVAPAWRHPVLGQTAKALAGTASVGLDARIDPEIGGDVLCALHNDA